MNETENTPSIGTCSEPCSHAPDGLKLSSDLDRVAGDLALLTHCRYKQADQAFKRFRIFHGLNLIWQAHCSHRLMLRILKEATRLMNKTLKDINKKADVLLKQAEAREVNVQQGIR